MDIHKKQIAALRLAIEALEDKRRTKFAVGDGAYRLGVRPDELKGDELKYTGLDFAEKDHKKYQQYTKAIQELEDLIDILEDPGVAYEDNADLPLFAEVK
jgi:hypothetical protein